MRKMKINGIKSLTTSQAEIVGNIHLYKQALATLASSLLNLSCGLANGISAVLLPNLAEDEAFYWENWYGSWIAAVAPFSSIIGCLCVSFLDCFGRKTVQVSLTIPFLIGWLAMALADDFLIMLLGRFLTGFSFGAVRPITSIYVGEISDPRYRGIFLLAQSLAINLGVLLSHIVATFLYWRTALLVCLAPNILVLGICLFFKESPYWLISKGRIEDGIQCFRWFRGTGDNAENELQDLLERQQRERLSLTFKERIANVCNRNFIKPFTTMFFISFGIQLCGVNSFPFYAKDLLDAMFESDIDTFLLLMTIDLVRVVVCILICLFGKMPRKRTYICSGYATVVALGGLVVFFLFDTDVSLVPISVTLLVVYTGVASVQSSVGWTFIGELYPTNLSNLGSGLSSAISYALLSLGVKVTPDLLACGQPIMYGIFAITTLASTIIVTVILPETNGKRLHEIEDDYNNENKTTSL